MQLIEQEVEDGEEIFFQARLICNCYDKTSIYSIYLVSATNLSSHIPYGSG